MNVVVSLASLSLDDGLVVTATDDSPTADYTDD